MAGVAYGGIALFCLALLIFLHRKTTRWRKWWLVIPIGVMGGCCFAQTGVGAWLANRVRDVVGWLVDRANDLATAVGAGTLVTAAWVLAVAAILMTLGAAYDLTDKRADRFAIVSFYAVPLLFLVAPGPVASTGGQLTKTIADLGSSALGPVLGA